MCIDVLNYLVAMVEVFDVLVLAVTVEASFHFQLPLAALTLAVLTFVLNSICVVVLVVLVADLNDALPFYGFYHFMVFTILWKSPY